MRRAFQLVMASLLATSMMAGAWAQTVKWVRESDSSFSAPTLYPNAARPTGVAIANGRQVMVLNGDGSVVMETTLDGDIATPVTVEDVDDDGAVELVVVLAQGDVVCLSREGKERWRYRTGSPSAGFNIPVVADAHPAPGREVLVGLHDGWLYCLSARGEVLWRFCGDHSAAGPPAVGDLDNDGAPEIVYGTETTHVYCLTGYGLVKWRFEEVAPYDRSGPNLADLSGDGKVEVLITRSDVNRHSCLVAIDPKGRLIWRTQDIVHGYASNATVDLDGDGKLEIFHADKAGNVYCENHDGTRRWMATFEGHGIFWAPAVADLDGDGQLEVVVGQRMTGDISAGAGLQMISSDGTVRPAPGVTGGANASPAVGDLDGDGQLEVVASMQFPNRLVCLTWGAGGRVGWPSLRGNSAMTGADPTVPPGSPAAVEKMQSSGSAAIDAGRAYWGDNTWPVTWRQPAPEGAFIELTAAAASGKREVVIQDVKQGATSAQVKCFLAAEGAFDISARLLVNSVTEPVFVATATVRTGAPEFCDDAGVEQVVNRAVAAGRAAGVESISLGADLLLLRVQERSVKEMKQGGAANTEIATAAGALRERAGELRNLATALGGLWSGGDTGAFVVWQDPNPWDAFDPRAIPEGLQTWPVVKHKYASKAEEPLPSERPVKVAVYGNEFENVALNLLNTMAKSIYVRCTFERPARAYGVAPNESPELAEHVTLQRLLPVAGAARDTVYDVLPKLDESGVIELVPGEVAQLWLTVKTHGLDSGSHRLTLYLGTMADKKDLTFREVPIEIEVWPVSLPIDKYQAMNWWRLEASSDQDVQSMIDHGMSVSKGPSLPGVPVDEQGNLAGEVDWTGLDQQVARVPKHWQFLWGSYPRPIFPKGVVAPAESELYFNGVKTAIGEMVKHLQSLGIGYDRWAFYPIDEPWLTGFEAIPELRRFCTLTKRADPHVRNYADPANMVRVEYIDEFKNLIDIWQPQVDLLKHDRELVKWFRANAKTFWFYEAAGQAQDLLPLGHYRTRPWLAWYFGATGSGFWRYKHLDMWWALDNTAYGAVYQTNKDAVTSRRWEAARDGIEDWRALYVLREEIEKARASGRTAAADAAQALSDEAVAAIIGSQPKHADERVWATGDADNEIDFDVLMDYRARIAEQTIRLRGR
ncbi:MAG TPA: FG-GAP-like repeat-containing protein [Armatimonadota bacterium]|nr:FG-GAP-like repeat-containing protein [Armatimonadota bacterium]